MAGLARNSITRKLTWMNLLVSGTALVIACATFLAYDLLTFRRDLVRTLSAQAQIVGLNSVSAIVFNDPASAEQTLSALRSSPNIRSATVQTPDGRTFASYIRRAPAQALSPLPPGQLEAHWFRDDEVVLARAILFSDKPLGTVYIVSNLGELNRRVVQYTLIAGLVLGLSLIVAFVVSGTFRRSIAQPVIELAQVAQTVSSERNYALRAPPPLRDDDELAVLVRSFNEMLAQIELRDDALRQARDQLELRVQQRTQELVAANKELEAFSYTVSHDLRGPIDVINGMLQILEQQYGATLDANAKEYLRHVRDGARRMSDLTSDLLELSRVTTSVMHREPVNLSSLAQTVTDELRHAEPQRQVRMQIAPGAMAQGDARLLRIVLENLLRNAWKFTAGKADACIEFGFTQDGRHVFFVRDNGVGFDADDAGRLFQPFQRLHSSAEFPGTGVGLATVRRIIERHDGKVWAEARPGAGATFFFSF